MDAFEQQATTQDNGMMGYKGQWFVWIHGAGNSIWMNENVLQSYEGTIRLAPVKLNVRANFTSLRTVGTFLINAEIHPGGKVTYAKITSEAGSNCKLIPSWNGQVCIREYPSKTQVQTRSTNSQISFATSKGKTYIVDRPTEPWEDQPLHLLY